jgi:hypothetical protein
LPPRCCRYCQQAFQPSKYRPDQAVCSQPECQRRRRRDYHREKLRSDPVYAQVIHDSQKHWCEDHPSYWKQYRERHPEVAERNRQRQLRRDQKRRIQNLAKNNLAFDLKHSAAEVWLLGPAAKDLAKNNLAFCKLFIFQDPGPSGGTQVLSCKEHRSGLDAVSPV